MDGIADDVCVKIVVSLGPAKMKNCGHLSRSKHLKELSRSRYGDGPGDGRRAEFECVY
jgi:hypothetical protein